ncbi:MAG: hypothetical protein ACFFAO_00445 [Candidatus Hermodarchaeota archaeon]
MNPTNYHDKLPILVEYGAYYSRVGFVGDQDPKEIYRTTIYGFKEQFANTVRNILNVEPSNYYVVIIKNTGTDRNQLKKEADILFNEFNVKGCAFLNAQTGIIFAWAHGYSGLIFDIGYDKTIGIPIICGKPVDDLVGFSSIAGKFFEEFITNDLIKCGSDKEIIKRNKETIIAFLVNNHYYFECQKDDFEFDLINDRLQNISSSLVIDDEIEGKVEINLPDPELPIDLLNESPNSKELSLNDFIIRTSKSCFSKIPFEKLERIIISGGGGQILGLRSFLINQLYELTSIKNLIKKYIMDFGKNTHAFHSFVRRVPPESYITSSWVGASIIFSLKYAPHLLISRRDYETVKPIIDFCDEKLEAGIKEHKF